MRARSWDSRTRLKQGLGGVASRAHHPGTTILIYHRVGGGSPDERDTPVASFAAQVDVLSQHRVVPLDTALDELQAGVDSPKVVLTFDDGFEDVYANAWPLLSEARLPFVVYVATAYIGGEMHWDGSTAAAPGRGLAWSQLREMVASGLCTVANHTHDHVRPEALTTVQLDRCSDVLREELDIEPAHFAYTWGIPVPRLDRELRARFRSAVTGHVGRNHPEADPLYLSRVPVRGSDPTSFFAAKLTGRLLAGADLRGDRGGREARWPQRLTAITTTSETGPTPRPEAARLLRPWR